MRVVFTFLFFTLIGLLINATIFHTTFPSSTAPDFILILTVALAFYYPEKGGLILAFLLGLFADFASAQYLGPNAAGSVIAFCFVGLIANRIYADKFFAVMIITFVCSLAKLLTMLLMYYVYLLESFDSFLPLLKTVFFEAALTALFAPLVLKILRRTKDVGNANFALKSNSVSIYRFSSKS